MRKCVLMVVGCAAAVAPVGAQTTMAVSPGFRATSEGNIATVRPFSSPDETRYQQVFGAGSLSSLSGMQITQISFRLDGGAAANYTGGFMYAPLVIRLSNTTAPVDGLSTTLDNNLGANVQTVYNGAFTVPTLHAGSSPNTFDLVIDLQMPFLYSGGNLLMDVTGPIGPATGGFTLDAEQTVGDAVSRAYQPASGGVVTDTAGLVTRFTGRSTGCYANCDGSTIQPVLNVNDFICFQWQFVAGTNYANCDGSTTPPVLNVSDFICFQSRFAAGCP